MLLEGWPTIPFDVCNAIQVSGYAYSGTGVLIESFDSKPCRSPDLRSVWIPPDHLDNRKSCQTDKWSSTNYRWNQSGRVCNADYALQSTTSGPLQTLWHTPAGCTQIRSQAESFRCRAAARHDGAPIWPNEHRRLINIDYDIMRIDSSWFSGGDWTLASSRRKPLLVNFFSRMIQENQAMN